MTPCSHVSDGYDTSPDPECLRCGLPSSQWKEACPCCGYPFCGHNHSSALAGHEAQATVGPAGGGVDGK